MDADGSHDPADVDRLLDASTSRRPRDRLAVRRRRPQRRPDRRPRVLSRGGNIYARLILRAGVNDLTGGFKAWRTDLLADLLRRDDREHGYGFQIEMTLRAAQRRRADRRGADHVPRTPRRRVEDELADRERGSLDGAVDGPPLLRASAARRPRRHVDDPYALGRAARAAVGRGQRAATARWSSRNACRRRAGGSRSSHSGEARAAELELTERPGEESRRAGAIRRHPRC